MHFDAGSADCRVLVFREGLLSSMGHDVTLRVTSLSIDISAADDAVQARFDARSLRVEGDVPPRDARDIERHAADDVLEARRFPEILFRSSSVTRREGGAEVAGELTLHGVTRALRCDAVEDERGWHTEVRLDQRWFSIRPYSAFLGALKVKPEVVVKVSLSKKVTS
jgi:polyisoprenoid-binding protein YceI